VSGVLECQEKYILEVKYSLDKSVETLLMMWSDREGVKVEEV
jgi:hypothetical protein